MIRRNQQHSGIAGNFALYNFIDEQRQPSFLQRNIRKVLRYHYRRQPNQEIYEADADMRNHESPGSRRTIAESSSPSSSPWTVEEVQQILSTKAFGPQDPVLVVQVTDIKDRLAKFRDLKVEAEPLKQTSVTRIRASCALTIWDASSPKQPTIVEQTRKCVIYPKAFASDERGASIEMEKPFVIPLSQFDVTRDGPSHILPEMQFSMQFVVMVANEEDLWPPVEMKLPSSKTASYRDSTGLVRFPVLAAKWHRLPRCPKNDQESILDLIASQDNNPYKPKLGLKIDASWRAAPTPLEMANGERKLRQKATPTTATPEPFAYVKNMDAAIEWTFEGLSKELRPIQLDRFCCPFCNMKDFQDPMQLHFHLLNSHPYLKFTLTLQLRNSLIEGTIHAEHADDYDADVEFDWHRPQALLELDKYFRGDESWLGKKAARTNNLLVPRAPASPRTPRSRSHDTSKLGIPLAAVTREASKVPDIPTAKKRKFRVPKAPDNNTRFFRLTTKRPLEEGEMVSESDDDIDEEWILRKHADTIDSFTDTTAEEKEFIQRFDRHMLGEDVSSDLHSSEALVRFCRINRKWLQSKSMRFEFHKKVATLKLQGCMTRKAIWDCMKIIDEPFPKEDPDAMELDQPIDTPRRLRSHVKESQAPEIGDILGRCAKCFSSITHPRTHVFCANPICPRPDYHLSCVGLSNRTTNWLCIECCASTPPHSTPPQAFHDAQTSPDVSKRSIPIRCE